MAIHVYGRVRDASSGRAIENVPVSNGEHVAPTDSAGRYALEISPGGHRFVGEPLWGDVSDFRRHPWYPNASFRM